MEPQVTPGGSVPQVQTPPPPRPTAPLPPPPPPPVVRPAPAPSGQKKPSGMMFLLILFVLIVAALVAAGMYFKYPPAIFGGAAEEEAAKPFVMGGILPLTGDGASYGVPVQQAAILAQKEINALGGIDGHQLEIIWRDGKCEGADAETAAREILDEYAPTVLLAGACSSEFLAAAPLAQERKVLAVSSSATNPKISELGKYVFRTAPSDALAGTVAAQYARNTMKTARAAIVSENKSYPLGLRDVFKAEFTGLGGEVVIDEVYETGTTDFKKVIERVKAAKPDVIYVLPQTPAPGVVIVKELKAQKVTANILTAEVLLIRDAVVEQGDILEGVIGVEVLFDKENPKAVTMLQSYEREFGREANYPNYMGGIYDMLFLLKEAYEATDGSPDAVSEYLYNLKEWDGTIGPISFDRRGDPSLPYQIIKITNRSTERVDVVVPTP